MSERHKIPAWDSLWTQTYFRGLAIRLPNAPYSHGWRNVRHPWARTILETRQSIFCFREIVMRADSWSVFVQQRFPYYLLLSLTKLWASSLLSTDCGWFDSIQQQLTVTTARTTQAQDSLFSFQVISEAFKYFQTLSNILRYSQAGLQSKFKQLNAGFRESMTLKFPMWRNLHQRSRPWNVDLWDHNSFL